MQELKIDLKNAGPIRLMPLSTAGLFLPYGRPVAEYLKGQVGAENGLRRCLRLSAIEFPAAVLWSQTLDETLRTTGFEGTYSDERVPGTPGFLKGDVAGIAPPDAVERKVEAIQPEDPEVTLPRLAAAPLRQRMTFGPPPPQAKKPAVTPGPTPAPGSKPGIPLPGGRPAQAAQPAKPMPAPAPGARPAATVVSKPGAPPAAPAKTATPPPKVVTAPVTPAAPPAAPRVVTPSPGAPKVATPPVSPSATAAITEPPAVAPPAVNKQAPAPAARVAAPKPAPAQPVKPAVPTARAVAPETPARPTGAPVKDSPKEAAPRETVQEPARAKVPEQPARKEPPAAAAAAAATAASRVQSPERHLSLDTGPSEGFLDRIPPVVKAGVPVLLGLVLGIYALVVRSSPTQAPTRGTGITSAVGEQGWVTEWASDAAGSRRGRQITLYRPSMRLSDYQMQFVGQIESKALGWVFRAADTSNYYAMKIEQDKPGSVVFTRFAVVDGRESSLIQKPLPIQVRADTAYNVRLEVNGPRFSVTVEGEPVEDWTDNRLKTGAVGFMNEREERGRTSSVRFSFPKTTTGR